MFTGLAYAMAPQGGGGGAQGFGAFVPLIIIFVIFYFLLLRPQQKKAKEQRNFLDCVKSRQQPVENLRVGHHVSTVAHLGNVAQRSGRKIYWDHEKEHVIGDAEADRLVGVEYRKPWRLPYYPEA